MEETIAYVREKYDNATGYLREIGLEDWEITKIRKNLMTEETEPEPLPAPKSRFSLQNFLPFTRRNSGAGNQEGRGHRGFMNMTSSPLPNHKKSTSLPREVNRKDLAAMSAMKEAEPKPEPQDEGDSSPIFRRASLAGSGPGEIRDILRQMREQHPELGPIREDGPIDFLRDSPPPGPPPVPKAKTDSSITLARTTAQPDLSPRESPSSIKGSSPNNSHTIHTLNGTAPLLSKTSAASPRDADPPPKSPFQA